MSTVLALSPHLDDAAFSAGGTLSAFAARGWRVVVATTFTCSVPDPQGFALACQLDKGLAPDVDYMALRREEDAAACAAMGAEARWLPLAEAPHRGYGSAPALFAGLHEHDDAVSELVPHLLDLLAELRPDAVFAPQAVGGHVDHCALVRALDRSAAEPPVFWWRDYPYIDREAAPQQPFAERFAAIPERRMPLDAASRQRKLEAALCYRSQLGFQFGGADALRTRLDATEPAEWFRSQAEMPIA